MKKTMINSLYRKADQLGYELTTEDIFAFERECIDTVSVRAGGYTEVEEYLEEKGLRKAYDDYERDPDDPYYDTFINWCMELNPAYNTYKKEA